MSPQRGCCAPAIPDSPPWLRRHLRDHPDGECRAACIPRHSPAKRTPAFRSRFSLGSKEDCEWGSAHWKSGRLPSAPRPSMKTRGEGDRSYSWLELHGEIIRRDALDIDQEIIDRLLVNKLQVVSGGTIRASGSREEAQEQRRKMFEIDLRVHMQRALQLNAQRLLFLDSRQPDLIAVSRRTQRRKRPVVVHRISETGAEDLFKMRTVENHAVAAEAIARQKDPRQLIAEQDQTLWRADIKARLGSVIRSKIEDLIRVSVACRARLVRRARAAWIHDRMYVLQVLIVKISIRSHFTSLGMRLVDLVAGLIEQHAVVVLDGQLDLGGALLGKIVGG